MKKKAHILFVQSSSDLYGSDKCLLNSASGLISMGYQVSAVLPNDGPLVQELVTIGVRTHIMRLTVFRKQLLKSRKAALALLLAIPSNTRLLKRLMLHEGIDLVHSNTSAVISGALAARRCKVPHVWHIREIFTEFKRPWFFYSRFIEKHSDRIICISEAVKKQFIRETARKKTVVVYDGTTMPMVSLDTISARQGNADLRILCMGRINPPLKGQDILVAACKELTDQGVPVKAEIVGDVFPGKEHLLRELQAQIESLGLVDMVTITGFTEDVTANIDRCDLVVVPSKHSEGFGIVALEAFARGKPVIASEVGGLPEIITNGNTGLLVKPDNASELAKAIKYLYENKNERLRLAKAGRMRLENDFANDTPFMKLAEIYTTILNGRSKPGESK